MESTLTAVRGKQQISKCCPVFSHRSTAKGNFFRPFFFKKTSSDIHDRYPFSKSVSDQGAEGVRGCDKYYKKLTILPRSGRYCGRKRHYPPPPHPLPPTLAVYAATAPAADACRGCRRLQVALPRADWEERSSRCRADACCSCCRRLLQLPTPVAAAAADFKSHYPGLTGRAWGWLRLIFC